MICESLSETCKDIADGLVFRHRYLPPNLNEAGTGALSPVAKRILYELYPYQIDNANLMQLPEFIALRLLDYLSSKQGYIRRKGKTFRHENFYRTNLAKFIAAVTSQKPLHLSSLCLCTTLANTKFAGQSPYPHMASYIALENIHKIAQGASKIYAPGIRFTLGFEGNLFRRLYFHSEAVTSNTFTILQELNQEAHQQVNGGHTENPVQVVDAIWMIEQTFGSFDSFENHVEKLKKLVTPEEIAIWQAWYRKTASEVYFPSGKAMDHFIESGARWRHVVYQFKYAGGELGKGFTCFNEDVIPFTPSSRRRNMITLQLVPENAHLPHHRVITHSPEHNRWRMMAYIDVLQSERIYAPRYVKNYLYPFYFEETSETTGHIA